MTKKYGKDTFRHTKKKYCIKKGVNSKKRGLRGGDPNLIIDADHTLHGFRRKFALTSLNVDNCYPWIQKVDEYEKKNKTNVKLAPPSQGYKDYYGCLNVLGRYVSFDTTLSTKSNPSETLTLKGCKAIKKRLELNSLDPMFKYEIFSPAATTAPPSGGTQQDTHVGTFTQLSISQILDMIKVMTKDISEHKDKNIQTLFLDVFHPQNNDGNALREDYFTCLEHVQTQFGPNVMTSASVSQSEKFRSVMLSKLCQFGKSEKCKILFVAGNVGTEIQDPKNNGAIFVLPSQFNGAEYLSPTNPLIDLNKYKDDFTGGPLGQLSCHPAVAQFVMNHAARSDFSSTFLEINAVDYGILGERMRISALKGLKISLNNGYLEVSHNLLSIDFKLSESSKPTQATGLIFNLFCQKLKVLQTDDVPTSGLTPANVYTSFNSGAISKVSLIYASAVPLNYNININPPINPEKSLLQYSVAGFNLVGQYFGAMVSAYNKKKQREDDVVKTTDVVAKMALKKFTTHEKAEAEAHEKAEAEAQEKHLDAVRAAGGHIKLFLTPLGGGVFQNPREMIACSVLLAYYMARQMLLNFDQKVEVIFLAWDSKDHEGNVLTRKGKKASVEDEDFSVFFKKDGEAPEPGEATSANQVISEPSELLTDANPNHPSNVTQNKLPGDGDDPDDDDDDDAEPISLPTRLIRSTTLPKAAATLPEAEEEKEEAAATLPKAVEEILPETLGGSKSRRRHRRHRKPARKTRRGRKSKSKTHRRRNACKNKKYTRKH
jgi:hypothetical protein